MYTTQADLKRIKQELATIQRQRETCSPYTAELKREIINYTVEQLAETERIYEIASELDLYGTQLVQWFKEACLEELPTVLEE